MTGERKGRLNIVIAMAGLSSRFARAGYTLPKYMLYCGGRSMLDLAVSSFEAYFGEARFIFVAREVFGTRSFIEAECQKMGLHDYTCAMLEQPTRGQAESVIEGARMAGVGDDEPLLIFNIDTFRPGFVMPERVGEWDGFLEVFEGSGPNWSYAQTEGEGSTRVVATAEKREISRWCSDGLYYFGHAADFREAFREAEQGGGELYVAPLYNSLIARGRSIHIHAIAQSEVIFCGTPEEYEDYLSKYYRQ